MGERDLASRVVRASRSCGPEPPQAAPPAILGSPAIEPSAGLVHAVVAAPAHPLCVGDEPKGRVREIDDGGGGCRFSTGDYEDSGHVVDAVAVFTAGGGAPSGVGGGAPRAPPPGMGESGGGGGQTAHRPEFQGEPTP